MAKGDTEDLAAQAAKRAEFRVHHVGTKLNERELGALEGLLAKRSQTQGEFIRGLILAEIERDREGAGERGAGGDHGGAAAAHQPAASRGDGAADAGEDLRRLHRRGEKAQSRRRPGHRKRPRGAGLGIGGGTILRCAVRQGSAMNAP
jgi:hypothetical protein